MASSNGHGANRAYCQTGIGRAGGGGFTFVELLIVVAILGIMAMIALPALGPTLAEARLGRAAADVGAAMEYASMHALGTGRNTRVVADATANRIVLEQIAVSTNILYGGNLLRETEVEGTTFVPVGHPLDRGRDYIIEVSGNSSEVDLLAADFGGSTSVVFLASGSASESGTLDLRLGDQNRRVSLNATTGKVTVQ